MGDGFPAAGDACANESLALDAAHAAAIRAPD